MERNTSTFEEDVHQKVISDLRQALDEMLHDVNIGRIARDSKEVLWAEKFARGYHHYDKLFTETKKAQMMESLTRVVNKRHLITITVLERKLCTIEGELAEARATRNKALDRLCDIKMPKLEGGLQS